MNQHPANRQPITQRDAFARRHQPKTPHDADYLPLRSTVDF
jgi:hypothetical protein